MSLLMHLLVRLVAVVLLCLAGAFGWVMVDAHRSIERETAASADRMGRQLEGLYWQKLLWRGGMQKDTLLPVPDWETLSTLTIISPGVCVSFAPPGEVPRRLCSQVETLGQPAPAWFATLYTTLLGAHEPVTRALSIRDKDAGSFVTEPDPDAALRQSWSRVSVIIGVATALATGIAVLAALMIGHALLPARTIVNGLRELQKGNNRWRLPRFHTKDLDHIACAVNDLAEELARTNRARAALTSRLMDVQQDERRALARELHDEFGQCLTATIALATLIESSSAASSDEISQDARKITAVQERMMTTLRSTLVRLRQPNIEELDLATRLRHLVSDYTTRSTSRTAFHLHLVGQMTDLPDQVATGIYRIAQECLTNAVKHGSPSEVRLKVEYPTRESSAVSVIIEDDGGGDAMQVGNGEGYGIIGVRERIAALGGRLSIANATAGIRISAVIPLTGSNDDFPVGEAA